MNTSETKIDKLQSIEQSLLSNPTFRIKRYADILLASFALLLSLPLWPFIAIAIKMSSRGPVFFRQQRIGMCMPTQTHIFKMIKFRTMANDAEKNTGAVWASKNDSRITTIGVFLRKTRLDELPQLINVLLGDMSLIGPRPERPGFYDKLEEKIPYFIERTYGIMPGITGLAQVNQGYDTCIEDVRSKLSYDLSYSLALSSPSSMLKTDFGIAWKTIIVMVCGRGQ